MNKTILLVFALIGVAICDDPELNYKQINKTAIVGNASKGDYQLRQYDEFSIATISNIQRTDGFHILEDYTGRFNKSGADNKQNQTVNFTWPVLSNQVMDGNFSMSFILNTTQVPTPVDKRIKTGSVKKGAWAIKQFSWNYSWKSGMEHLLQLFLELRADGIIPKTMRFSQLKDFKVAHFSVEFSVPFQKRHEVWIRVNLDQDNKNLIE